jgi:menaquinone-9 beta-reductase
MKKIRSSTSTTDVLIVGGGPAGLATAIALRQRNIECVVVEARSSGIDKACGEGLMPDTLASLASLEVNITEADGFPLRGIRFANSVSHVEASFPNGFGVGVRRPLLHSHLANAADRSGAELLWNSRVVIRSRQSAMVNGEPLNFRWLVGADGTASSIRSFSGLDAVRQESFRYGFRRHYQVEPWSDYVEIHWGRGGQFYVTPVGTDCVCVVFVSRYRHVNHSDIFAGFPEISRRLGDAPAVSVHRGALTASRKLRRVANEFTALVGDASGSADSITGEGLGMSFRQAQALAECIQSGSLDAYGHLHEQIGKLPHAMGNLILTMDRWPALESRAMQVLSSDPVLFHDLLSVHMGSSRLIDVLLRKGPRFGWNVLRASVEI